MDASKLMGLMKDKKAAMARHERTVKPRAGKNRIALLPGWEKGNEHVWFHDYGQHFIKNAAGEIQAVYPCSEAIYGEPCPVCAALGEAVKMAPDDATIALLNEAKAGRRVLMNVLDLDGDKPNEPVIYEVAPSVFGYIVELIEEWGVEAFKREIVINREGKGLNTKYSAQISPKQIEIAPAVIAKIHNLSEYVKQESEEQQRRAIKSIGAISGVSAGRLGYTSSTVPAGAIPETPEGGVSDETVLVGESVRVEEASAAGDSSDLDDLLSGLE